MTVGGVDSTERPPDRADVARFYAGSSPSFLLNLAAREVSAAQDRSLSHNARALALINMAISDSLVASFFTKYHYNLWRPETAIRLGDTDGNPKTDPDPAFAPFILTPCFPSYPSNHASGSSGGAEMLRRLYGAGGHDITLANPAVPGMTLHYSAFKQITDDVDDARVYSGIHFRFDQEAGGRLGRGVATYIYKHGLRPVHPDGDEE
ncbi:MAG TPA: vanadium-dependent haloperoxidase [Actinomycetota bacterium]|nr:vanadium-dependent haloperoxidase [Actinomycetota bacterium]